MEALLPPVNESSQKKARRQRRRSNNHLLPFMLPTSKATSSVTCFGTQANNLCFAQMLRAIRVGDRLENSRIEPALRNAKWINRGSRFRRKGESVRPSVRTKSREAGSPGGLPEFLKERRSFWKKVVVLDWSSMDSSVCSLDWCCLKDLLSIGFRKCSYLDSITPSDSASLGE